VRSRNNDDRGWRVIGLAWAGKDRDAPQKAVKELLAAQKPDGGWSDMETMETSAYATGKALVALHNAGMAATDAPYERGVRYLLNTQQEDGSWYVKTRALALQPFFDGEFPHGLDQWISAAGTSWATIALAQAEPQAGTVSAAGGR
jgi:squalene cyclase